MRFKAVAGAVALLTLGMFGLAGSTANAQPLSGAIFTTVADGSEVNFNHYPSKEAVYLDGGPGPGAPVGAAGLPDGTYVFQVTDPSGKTLLSNDAATCRQIVVSGGIITAVVASGCQHLTGTDIDHGATTVQLFPYDDTPNNGGVYKVWVTPLADFLANCGTLGVANGLAVVDCGSAAGNRHGFVPSDSKTDNFKVKETVIKEIDTRFFADYDGNGDKTADEPWLLGRSVTWTDPLGGSNKKWSYYAPQLQVFNEAHVEAVEDGTHLITLSNQAGCTIGDVRADGAMLPNAGPQTVSVSMGKAKKSTTVFIDVACVG